MRVKADHGYYRFYPESLTDIQRLKTLYDIDLVPVKDYYTFKEISDMKEYSLKGMKYLDFTYTKTAQGSPEFIFKNNRCVFDVVERKIKPIEGYNQMIKIQTAVYYYIMPSIIPQIGVFANNDGERLISFDGSIDSDTATLRCRGVELE